MMFLHHSILLDDINTQASGLKRGLEFPVEYMEVYIVRWEINYTYREKYDGLIWITMKYGLIN